MALQPIPGFLYLQRPHKGTNTVAVTDVDIEDAPAELTDAGDAVRELRGPAPADIARLLHVWLEALDGRRPLKSLHSGRFHPRIVEHIPSQLTGLGRRAPLRTGGRVASAIRSLHLQPSQTHRVRFCASVLVGGRVRAVAGTTSRVRMKKGSPRTAFWRLETLQII